MFKITTLLLTVVLKPSEILLRQQMGQTLSGPELAILTTISARLYKINVNRILILGSLTTMRISMIKLFLESKVGTLQNTWMRVKQL